jgi:hypothetical protein
MTPGDRHEAHQLVKEYLAMPHPGSLQSALTGAKPYAQARYLVDSQLLALVIVMHDGYWARLFTESYTSDPGHTSNRRRDSIGALAALLAEAGIPVERGWEAWVPKKDETKGSN